jgi:hypothetical protein
MNLLQIKATITDIESKLDKNGHPFYKISLSGLPNYFYAFSSSLKETALNLLTETPEKLVHQLTLITYEKLPNKENLGTFCKVKEIQLL